MERVNNHLVEIKSDIWFNCHRKIDQMVWYEVASKVHGNAWDQLSWKIGMHVYSHLKDYGNF